MKLVVKLKIVTDASTDRLLRQTTEQYRLACNHLSKTAFSTRTFHRYDLHRLCYQETRALSGLPSQLVVRAIAEVSSAYRSQLTQVKEHNLTCPPEDRRELTPVEFAPNLALPYDQRLLTYTQDDQVSLRLLERRCSFLFQVGDKHRLRLKLPRGQADLKRFGKEWFLFQTVEVEEPQLRATTNFVGVDCGLCTVASSYDGCTTERHSGTRIRRERHHHSHLRRGLQRHNTKSSRSRVRKLRDREARRVRNENHRISRRIVMQAERTNSTIVLEDLAGIRERNRVTQGQRYERFSWSYFQLQSLIVYKARLAGIPVVFVLPAYTSQTCSRCFFCSRNNRQNQAWFQCRECGYSCYADDNASVNIRFLGGASTAQKRTVKMEEYLHRDCRKPLALARGKLTAGRGTRPCAGSRAEGGD